MPNYSIYAETTHRWLSSLDQRLSPPRATDSSQFDQNENVLRISSPTILCNVASSKNLILQRSCARRVFLREKRSRFLGQEKFEQGQFNTTSSPAISASQLASKSTSQKTVKPTASKQPATHHHNTATQQANHPADQLTETSQPKASSSNHPIMGLTKRFENNY